MTSAAAKTTPKKAPAMDPHSRVPTIKEDDTFSGRVKTFAYEAKSVSVKTIKDPSVQASAASAAAGTLAFGACGGMFGLFAGGVVGLPFAIFTFGLSIPISAAIGGGVGVVAGGAAGCATGSATGFTVYKRRKEINSLLSKSVAKVKKAIQTTELYVQERVTAFLQATRTKIADLRTFATSTAEALTTTVKERSAPTVQMVHTVAKNPHAQVTAASAAAGGLACGLPCGATGLIGGAIVGVVPAIFTFGLSIPVFAVVGGSAGLCIGGTVGATGAGAVGYGVYAKKAEIRQGANSVVAYVKKMLGRQ